MLCTHTESTKGKMELAMSLKIKLTWQIHLTQRNLWLIKVAGTACVERFLLNFTN